MNQDLINRAAALLELKSCMDNLENNGYMSFDARADIINQLADTAFDILDEIVCSMRKED